MNKILTLNRIKKIITFAMVLAIGLVFSLPQNFDGANAATTTDLSDVFLKRSITSKGQIKYKWKKVDGAVAYSFELHNKTTGEKFMISRTTTSYTLDPQAYEVLTHGCTYYATVTAQKQAQKRMITMLIIQDSGKYTFTDVTSLSLGHANLNINKGKSRQLHLTYESSASDLRRYSKTPEGVWRTSNAKVATVKDGLVTAVASGKCEISYHAVGEHSVSIPVTVLEKSAAKGSMYVEDGLNVSWTSLVAMPTMRQGTENRLNGIIRSDTKLKKISVKILDEKGNAVVAYKKKCTTTRCDLRKYSNKINFAALEQGQYSVKVYATNTLGVTLVQNEPLTVLDEPTADDWGAKIIRVGATRIGDPYNSWKRGEQNYTDCSYFAKWTYHTALGVELPESSADQYKYCVKNKMTVKKKNLQPGDLIFAGGSGNGRYKGINHVSIYFGDGLRLHANGTTVAIDKCNFTKTTYYGRPYSTKKK